MGGIWWDPYRLDLIGLDEIVQQVPKHTCLNIALSSLFDGTNQHTDFETAWENRHLLTINPKRARVLDRLACEWGRYVVVVTGLEIAETDAVEAYLRKHGITHWGIRGNLPETYAVPNTHPNFWPLTGHCNGREPVVCTLAQALDQFSDAVKPRSISPKAREVYDHRHVLLVKQEDTGFTLSGLEALLQNNRTLYGGLMISKPPVGNW